MNCGDNCDEYDNRADNIMLNMNENKYSGANFDNVFDPNVLEFSKNCQNIQNLCLSAKSKIGHNTQDMQASHCSERANSAEELTKTQR